jgi:prepilin-type N-terminal cleavage/methylation domain-containing protein
MRTHDDRSESGFNLIEVVIALALLAAVLLTISGLFIQGSQSVNTGRDLTEATSLATDILEQMDKWAFSQLYTNWNVCTTGVCTELTYTSTAGGTYNAVLAGMCQTKINARLPNAKATVVITPLGQTQFVTSGGVVCKGIRVKVTIDWTLKLKPRNVSLETVRF